MQPQRGSANFPRGTTSGRLDPTPPAGSAQTVGQGYNERLAKDAPEHPAVPPHAPIKPADTGKG